MDEALLQRANNRIAKISSELSGLYEDALYKRCRDDGLHTELCEHWLQARKAIEEIGQVIYRIGYSHVINTVPYVLAYAERYLEYHRHGETSLDGFFKNKELHHRNWWTTPPERRIIKDDAMYNRLRALSFSQRKKLLLKL